MKDVIPSSYISKYLVLLINVVKFNAAYLDEDVTVGLVLWVWYMEARIKWWIFCRRHFQKHLLEWKSKLFLFKFYWFVPKGPVDSKSALVPVMAYLINDGQDLWCPVTKAHRTWSTLVQVMACCLKELSHYLTQCCLIISEVLCKCSRHLSLILVQKFTKLRL